MNEPKPKAFVYLRRSQDREDRQLLSIEGQKKALTKVIEQEGFSPIYMPAESQTASKIGRPIFNDMTERIHAGEARYIVVWSANRLSRNSKDAGDVIYAMDEGSLLAIITPSKRYSAAKDDKFMLGIEFGTSKLYSDEISANVLRGNEAKYERGEYPGNAPIGYENVKIGHYKNIAPDPKRSELVKEAFRLAATGTYTLDELHRLIRDIKGLTTRTGRPIGKSTFYDMLQRKLYTGTFKYGGSWRIGSYEPLVSHELFDKVQVAMGWAKNAKRQRSSTSGRDYAFKGPIRCGGCGHSVTASTKPKVLKTTGQQVEYVYYNCTRKSKFVACKEPQISEAALEKQIIEEFSKLTINKSEAQKCIELLKKHHTESVKNRNQYLDVWAKDLKDVRMKLDSLLDMRMNDEISESQFKAKQTSLVEIEVRTEQLISQSNIDANDWLELADSFFSKAVTLVDDFEEASIEEKKRIMLTIGSNWTLSNKKVRLTPREPFDSMFNRTKFTNWRARPDLNRRSPA